MKKKLIPKPEKEGSFELIMILENQKNVLDKLIYYFDTNEHDLENWLEKKTKLQAIYSLTEAIINLIINQKNILENDLLLANRIISKQEFFEKYMTHHLTEEEIQWSKIEEAIANSETQMYQQIDEAIQLGYEYEYILDVYSLSPDEL
jgi:hypothetical protein